MAMASSPLAWRLSLIMPMAQSTTVRVFKPKKSNFTNPASSTSFLSYWVTKPDPSASQYKGEKSVSLVGAITTPPACLPTLRVRPSS